MLDGDEFDRWRRTADGHLRAARHSAAGGFASTAVLLVEQAGQCTMKALLLGVGRRSAARGHALLTLEAACREHAGLALAREHRDGLARLARDYQPSRYPDALPGGTPEEHFGEADASGSIATADAVTRAVDDAWQRLREAEIGDEAGTGDDGTGGVLAAPPGRDAGASEGGASEGGA